MSTKAERLVQNNYSRLFFVSTMTYLLFILLGMEILAKDTNPLTLQSFKHPQDSSFIHTEEDCALSVYKNMERCVL